MKIFLGGTTTKDPNKDWRASFIQSLNDGIEYFNPIVQDWNETAKQNELLQRKVCDVVLYVLTPEMTGVYSIAEITEDCITKTSKIIIVVLDKYDGVVFNEHQMSSIESCKTLWSKYTEHIYSDLTAVAQLVNDRYIKTKLLRNW